MKTVVTKVANNYSYAVDAQYIPIRQSASIRELLSSTLCPAPTITRVGCWTPLEHLGHVKTDQLLWYTSKLNRPSTPSALTDMALSARRGYSVPNSAADFSANNANILGNAVVACVGGQTNHRPPVQNAAESIYSKRKGQYDGGSTIKLTNQPPLHRSRPPIQQNTVFLIGREAIYFASKLINHSSSDNSNGFDT